MFTSGLFDPVRITEELRTVGSRLANEIQYGKMSLYESDSASASQILFDYFLCNQTLEIFSVRQPSITTTDNIDGVNTFQIFLQKQLKHMVSFELGFCT